MEPMTKTRQRRWTVTYTRQRNHPEHVEILALTAEAAAEHARTHIAAAGIVEVVSVELAPARQRKAKAAPVLRPEPPMFEVVAEFELDGFDAWAADNGELPTTFVDGAEVVEPTTIAEFAFAIEVAAAAAAGDGRLF